MPREPGGIRDLAIELLGAGHVRERFDCSIPALNEYLKTQAHQEAIRGVATPYVLVRRLAPAEILGFYTLSSTGVRLADLPEAVARKLPRYPLVPATLIGRLAVHTACRGQGLGERLLVDALKRSLEASTAVASVAVFIDAKDKSTAGFYERYGFRPLPSQPLRLFISMKTIAQLWPTG